MSRVKKRGAVYSIRPLNSGETAKRGRLRRSHRQGVSSGEKSLAPAGVSSQDSSGLQPVGLSLTLLQPMFVVITVVTIVSSNVSSNYY